MLVGSAVRRVAIIGGVRIPFARAHTAYAKTGNQEMLTAAGDWVRDQCQAEDEESDAFRDVLTAGMGWTDTLMDYDENPDGDVIIERRDPMLMPARFAVTRAESRACGCCSPPRSTSASAESGSTARPGASLPRS